MSSIVSGADSTPLAGLASEPAAILANLYFFVVGCFPSTVMWDVNVTGQRFQPWKSWKEEMSGVVGVGAARFELLEGSFQPKFGLGQA